jgi:hypothetical protein
MGSLDWRRQTRKITGAERSTSMGVNVFEGSRRIAKLLAAIWIVGAVGYHVMEPPRVYVTASIAAPGAAPEATFSAYCASPNASETVFYQRTPAGTNYQVGLCFLARKFPKGMLVPYKRDGSTVWGETWLSPEVGQYARDVVSKFEPTRELEALADLEGRQRTRQHWINCAIVVAAGLLALWLVVTVIGWIVRGFLGILRGQDALPAPSTPRPPDIKN